MKLCRFNKNRLGVVLDGGVADVTDLFDTKPTWPLPPGDWIMRQVPTVQPRIAAALKDRPLLPLKSLKLDSPVASPGKIVGAPINYSKHIEEARADAAINHGRTLANTLEPVGVFIKANSAMIGPSEQVQLRLHDRRNDHEVELAVVIGKEANFVSRDRAMEYVLGYTIGLDMTIRGPEMPTFRKSADTYAVVGPWLVTADEIPDPSNLKLKISVNGEVRQDSNTSYLIFDVPRLIEYITRFYTLHPGDIIMTGTPEGVSQVNPGEVMDAWIEGVGDMRIQIADTYADKP